MGARAVLDDSGSTVIPFEGNFGADILGFDFNALSQNQVDAVRAAWLEYGVLRFRDFRISSKQQIEFSKLFGRIEKHPGQLRGQPAAHETYEEIFVASNAIDKSEIGWHTDGYFWEHPSKATVLRAVHAPSDVANTYFADMDAIYDALPPDLRNQIEGRNIQCDLIYTAGGRLRPGQPEPETKDIRQWPHIRHPIVRTHEETGRKSVFVGAESKGNWVVGLSLEKSASILQSIFDYVNRPEFQFRQMWQDGDIVL